MNTLYNPDVPLPVDTTVSTCSFNSDNNNDILVGSNRSRSMNHHNYLEYLELAWQNHFGIVIDPKFFWYMILTEATNIIATDPNKYRSLFTTSNEKKMVTVLTDDPLIIPVNSIVSKLTELVPTDTSIFFPTFSTSTPSYHLAAQIAFCDAVSPYYEYSMCMCGISSYQILGTDEDWTNLHLGAILLLKLLGAESKFSSLLTQLESLSHESTRGNIDTWIDMFRLDRCGSGSDVVVAGWIDVFFAKSPSLKYVGNYPSQVSSIDYKNLDTDIDYTMYCGLFNSTLEDGRLIPEYEWVVKEKTA